LEHQAYLASRNRYVEAGVQIEQLTVTHGDVAMIGYDQTCQTLKQSALTSPRRTEQDRYAGLSNKVDV